MGTDAINYVADNTQGTVEKVARSFNKGMQATQSTALCCHKYNEENEASFKFCKSCGTSLQKSKGSTSCGELNDLDANFCDNSGYQFSKNCH